MEHKWASEADRVAYEQDVLNHGTGYYTLTSDGLMQRIAPEAVTIMLDPDNIVAAEEPDQ